MNTKLGKTVSEWCGVLCRDDNGRATLIHCPAHSRDGEPRVARVALHFDAETITVACANHPLLREGQTMECDATLGQNLCYHGIAAIIYRVAEANGRCFFYDQQYADRAEKDAAKYGSRMFSIRYCGHYNGAVVIDAPALHRQVEPVVHTSRMARAPLPAMPIEGPDAVTPALTEMAGKIAALTKLVEELRAKDAAPPISVDSKPVKPRQRRKS